MNTNPQDRGQWTSASYAPRDALCPGAHLASRDLPEDESEDAKGGTAVHKWLHWRRTIPSTMTHLEVETATQPRCDFELAGRCWEMECKAVVDWLETVRGNGLPEMQMFSERRFWLFLQTGSDPVRIQHLQHSGQADCAIVCGKRALILDTKSGWMEVTPPASNEQLRDLAVLVGTEHSLDEVTVKIIQPGAKQHPSCVYDRAALAESHRRLVARVIASNDPKAPRIPGVEQCRWCKARGTSRCPESHDAVNHLAVDHVLAGKELAEIPSPELLHACLLAEPIIRAVKDRARAALEQNPDAIEGFTLKPNPPNRPITNPQTLWARCSTLGLTLEQFLGCISVTKGELEEALKTVIRERTGEKRVQGWSKTWAELLDGLTTEEPKKPSVVPKE